MSNRPTRPAAFAYRTMLIVQLLVRQMIPLRPFGEFVDAAQIHQQKPPRINVRGIEAIEVYGFVAIVGAHSHEITLVTHHVDQLELLEQGGDGREALAYLRSRPQGRYSAAERCRK